MLFKEEILFILLIVLFIIKYVIIEPIRDKREYDKRFSELMENDKEEL